MKNRTSDVRDHLVAMLEALGDDEKCTPEVIERAKASAAVAAAFTSSVKTALLRSDAGNIQMMANHEQAVLARLPKPDAEPVAWKVVNGGTNIVTMRKSTAKEYAALGCNVTPLYAHPPQDTAERNALVRRIDAWGWFDFVTDTERLFKDIRAHLVGGAK